MFQTLHEISKNLIFVFVWKYVWKYVNINVSDIKKIKIKIKKIKLTLTITNFQKNALFKPDPVLDSGDMDTVPTLKELSLNPWQ